MSDFIKCDYTIEDLEQFRDKDGFIDLSKTGISITKDSREKRGTAERLKNWVDFRGKKALLRGEVVDNYSIYAELIVEEIAKQIGIETAHYDLIKIKDENGIENFGVLSESIIDLDKEQLISLHDLIGDEPESEDIMDEIDFEASTRYQFTKSKLIERLNLAGYSEEDINQILLDYDKRLVFYLSVLDTDKHPENISFVKEKKGNSKIRLSPNYDSEFSLLLEYEKEMGKIFVEQPFGVEMEAEVKDPKIGIIVRKEDGGWNEMWKDTLEKLIENDDVYDYYNNHIRRKIDMDIILKRVEDRIHVELPKVVKELAKRSYNSRNEAMEMIIDGEIFPEETKQEEIEDDISALLNSLINSGIQSSIRTGEQLNIGQTMEKDIKGEFVKEDKDILDEIFPDFDN